MSINYQALTLGDCELYLNDQHLGLATGLTLYKLVERLPIERSVSGELAAQHLVPIRRAFSVEARLKEFSPVAFSFFANGGTSLGLAVANLGVTDFVRLYEGRPTRLRFLPGSPPMVKNADGSILYVENGDYLANWLNGQFSLAPNSRIEHGQLLKVLYTTDFLGAREVPLMHASTVTTKLEAVHRYPDGESFLVLHLRRVELDASGLIATGTEDLVEVPLTGRCLADTNHPESPFGYVRFYGPLMVQMENRP